MRGIERVLGAQTNDDESERQPVCCIALALGEMLRAGGYARRRHALVEEAGELIEASRQDANELKLCASTR